MRLRGGGGCGRSSAPLLKRMSADEQEAQRIPSPRFRPCNVRASGPVSVVRMERSANRAQSALNRMRGRIGGEDQDMWYRTTMCFQRIGERWRIVHDHSSVPFYMDGSYRAAVDLNP
jgi:SnoaL-like domain